MSSPSIKPQHYLAYGIYRGFEATLKLFPIELVCLVGGLLGNIAWLVMRQRKNTVTRNLRIAFGREMTRTEINTLCRQCFQTVGSNMIASIRAVFLSDAELEKRIAIEGIEHITPMIDAKEGFIGLLAHMGNWEVLSQLQRYNQKIPSFGGLYRPLDNPLMDRLIKRRRQKSNSKLFSRRDGFFKPTAYLKDGNPLGVFADQHAGKHGVAIPFFGKMTSMTNLPSILHTRAKAHVVPLSVTTTGLGQWKIKIHPPVKLDPTIKPSTNAFVLATARAYETLFHDSPRDVLWMHNYWRVGFRQPLKVDGARRAPLQPLGHGVTQPFQILLYAPQDHVSQDALIWVTAQLKASRTDIHLTLVRENNPGTCCDHLIDIPSANDPPHMLNQSLSRYEETLPSPLDLALDLTPKASGTRFLKASNISPVISLTGKYQHRTKQARNLQQASGEIEKLSLFLASLGLDLQSDHSTEQESAPAPTATP